MRTRKHIIAIVGESGSGKTLASQLLTGPGCKTIVSYTTRPMRKGEVDGVDHWFVNNDRIPDENEIAASTMYGGYFYWTEWKQFEDDETLSDNYFAYVIDEKGLMNLYSNPRSHEFNIIPIKINRPHRDDISEDRKNRDIEREKLDNKIYDYIVENDGTLESFKSTIDSIFQYIKSQDIWQHQKMNR